MHSCISLCQGGTEELGSETLCFITNYEEYSCQQESAGELSQQWPAAASVIRFVVCPPLSLQSSPNKMQLGIANTFFAKPENALLDTLGPHIASGCCSVLWFHCCCARLAWSEMILASHCSHALLLHDSWVSMGSAPEWSWCLTVAVWIPTCSLTSNST